MIVHEIDVDRADAIEAGLSDAFLLEGEHVLEEWTPGRYRLQPASSQGEGFTALNGRDEELGPVTLLRSPQRCVVMVGSRARPFG
jgi:hypothetical protein